MSQPSQLRGAFRVPLSVLRDRVPDWQMLSEAGDPLTAEHPAWSQVGAVALIPGEPVRLVMPFLRAALPEVMADAAIPPTDRAWALHRALLFEMATLAMDDYRTPSPGPLRSVIDLLVAEAARLARGEPTAEYAHESLMSTEYALIVHQVETALYTMALAGTSGIEDSDALRDIALTALFADAGLSRVPRSLLRSTGPLTDGQWGVIRRHPRHSANILLASGLATSGAVRSVLAHHERWDGRGYPLGMEQEEIPLPARLVALADAFSAMSVRRPYRPAASPQEAMQGMVHSRGQFQPSLLRTFVELLARRYDSAAA